MLAGLWARQREFLLNAEDCLFERDLEVVTEVRPAGGSGGIDGPRLAEKLAEDAASAPEHLAEDLEGIMETAAGRTAARTGAR